MAVMHLLMNAVDHHASRRPARWLMMAFASTLPWLAGCGGDERTLDDLSGGPLSGGPPMFGAAGASGGAAALPGAAGSNPGAEVPGTNGVTPLSPGGGGAGGSGSLGPVPPGEPARNLFGELLGRTQAEVDQKVATAVNRFFGINTGEPATPTRESGFRCYYELPQDPSMAFIWAADSNDVRSEGMSYGMTVAVQMDLQPQFDRLWKFAKTYMQYPPGGNVSAWTYYFRWQGRVDTTNAASWAVNYGPTTVPAPDGDEYFAAALYLANRRWGSAGAVNYLAEANDITRAMLHNTQANGRFPIIHATQNMVVFVPNGMSNNFSDPSYHLPAFYELFAIDGPPEDSARWRSVAQTSRAYLVTSAHPTTGLHPDYATFAGAPTAGGDPSSGHDQFRFDAWRVVMNMAVDYAWFVQDPRMKTQIEKYHAFFADHLGDDNMESSLFNIDGSNPSGGGSTALTATLASGAVASELATRTELVDNLWRVPQQSGEFRYYQESVYLLGLLSVAGKFNHEW